MPHWLAAARFDCERGKSEAVTALPAIVERRSKLVG